MAPSEIKISTGVVYSHAGQADRWAELCRQPIAAREGSQFFTRACLVMAL
ncbi:hypothetical protein [Mycobacterium tilburgii]|nr:hypothetical protein [Mycobacterium tilburgii]